MHNDSVITALEVAAEPDGVSTGLIACELNESERAIEPVVHHARDQG
jgi:hypothetical protein